MDSDQINAIKVLKKELENLRNEPIYSCGVTVGLINGPNDLFHWRITMIGPKNTPYENGLFQIIADFPPNYPKKGPKMRFTNKMFHCNVSAKGEICISTLTEWKEGTTMTEVLPLIFALFFMQNPESPFDKNIANLYQTTKAEFDKKAREYTKKYADPNI